MSDRGGRRRPAGGGVVFNVGARAFECQGCGNLIPVKSAVVRDPEAMTQMRESLVNRHTECWSYPTQRDARMARVRKRIEKMQRGLAAQQVSWRGGLCG